MLFPPHKAADYIIAKLKWGPKNEAELAVQRELAEEFEVRGVDFMSMDPEVHFSILQEALVFRRVPRTVEMFLEIAEAIGFGSGDDWKKAAQLAKVYRARLDIIHATGGRLELESIPESFRRF